MNFNPLEKADAWRRTEIVSKLKGFIQGEKTGLDVGCGSGKLTAEIGEEFGMKTQGIDLKRPKSKSTKFKLFDGQTIPFENDSFDAVFLFDALHHVSGKTARQRLLSECSRVARQSVILKDHYYSTFLQKQYLKLVDSLTNFLPLVSTPFEFIKKREWDCFDYSKKEYWVSMGIPNIMLKIEKNPVKN